MSDLTQKREPRSSTTVFDTLDALCSSFVSEWESGSRPDLGKYLYQVGEETRPSLMRNLLLHELRFRRACGDTLSMEEYLERYPDFTNIVRQVFLESTDAMLTPQVEETRSFSPKLTEVKAPTVQRLGDFRLLRELGRGGMGVVFEAVNLRGGDRVALKTLPLADGSALPRFKREFRSAADLNHPNLIGLHNLEADGLQWFFTMDLLDGSDFRAYVRPGGKLDELRLRAALAQLAAGVMALHGAGVVHRDLKPSNVIVTSEGRVVILDFGLVFGLTDSNSLTNEQMVGTPLFMAPEQVMGGSVTASTDWYSVGVMLYEALLGQPPFTGSMFSVLNDKQRLDAPPLPDDPTIPADLAAFCMRLLNREPGNRPDALEVARVVAISPSLNAPAISQSSRLIGRSSQLKALEEASQKVDRDGNPLVIFVRGRSGEGKTSLVEQFLTPLKKAPTLAVMAGRCYDRESVPFKALDNLIDALSAYLRLLPMEDAALLMPDDIAVLAQVFPVLKRIEVVAKASGTRQLALDEQQVRLRAFAALRSLLGRIGRKTPVIWFVDDLQWGDADSADALFEALRPPEAPPILFLGTFRSDEEAVSPFLIRWNELSQRHGDAIESRSISVGPLSLEQGTELVIELIQRDSEEVRRRAEEIFRQTGGNPFLLVELAGCYDPETDSFRSVPMREVLARKLGRLPDDAEALLNLVAISGQSLALDELTRAAGLDSTPVATMTRMRNERLLRLVGTEREPLVDTYHDKIRETVLNGLPDSKARALHETLAETIEAASDFLSAEEISAIERGELATEGRPVQKRIFDLAYHFDAAGVSRKAFAYSLFAAEQAGRQSALEVAADKYAIAERNSVGVSDAVRYRLHFGYAKSLTLLGRYQEAENQLVGAIDLVNDPLSQARIEALQGELCFKQGHLQAAISTYRGALKRLGVRVPKTSLGSVFGVLKESVVQLIHSYRRGSLYQQKTDDRTDLLNTLLIRISISSCFLSTPLFAWAVLKGLNQAEKVKPTRSLAYARGAYGVLLSILGWNSLALKTYSRAAHLADELNDLWSQGQSLGYKALGLYAAAQYEEAIEPFGRSIMKLSESGDLWELNMVQFHLACTRHALADLPGAVDAARWTFESSVRIGDPRSHCSLYIWSKIMNGNIPFDQLKTCISHNIEDFIAVSNLQQAEAYWHLHHGRLDEAIHCFEKAFFVPLKHHLVNFHPIAALPALVGVLRLDAEKHRETDPSRSRRQLSRALRLGRRGVVLSRFFPATLPQSLRELSLVQLARGQLKPALKLAESSKKVAEQQKAKYEQAKSLLAIGQVGLRLGTPGADAKVREAKTIIREIELALLQTLNKTPG